jgi:hypothetical protein
MPTVPAYSTTKRSSQPNSLRIAGSEGPGLKPLEIRAVRDHLDAAPTVVPDVLRETGGDDDDRPRTPVQVPFDRPERRPHQRVSHLAEREDRVGPEIPDVEDEGTRRAAARSWAPAAAKSGERCRRRRPRGFAGASP